MLYFVDVSIFKQTNGPLFRNLPFLHLKSYLENMHQSDDKERFLMLVYMSLNQMVINVNNPSDMLFEILESCNCDPTNKETKCGTKQIEFAGTNVKGERSNTEQGASSGNRVKKHFKSKEFITSLIPEEFVNKEDQTSVYILQHDVIKRMTLVVFGTYHFDKCLDYLNKKI